MYRISGIKEEFESVRDLHRAMVKKGYRGSMGPFGISQWLNSKGRDLIDIDDKGKKFIVGRG